MLRMEIIARVWDKWRAVPFVSLGAVFCFCLPIFLTAASFVLFIAIVFSFCWMPVRLSMVLLNALHKVTTSQIAPASSTQIQDHNSRRITDRRLPSNACETPVSRDMLLTGVGVRGSSQLIPDSYCAPGILASNRNAANVTACFAASGVNHVSFVQPPPECSGEEIIRPTIGPLERLPREILEEIVSHLPNSSISCLALVSKEFGTQFRFCYVNSGMDRFSITRFRALASELQLGQFTTRMVVHPNFFRLPLKVQWSLDVSSPSLVEASGIITVSRKQWLLDVVLKACPRLHSLTWNEGNLPLFPTILQTLRTSLFTSLRYLDISVDSQLLTHLLEIPPSPPYHLMLTSLTLRGSISQDNANAITNLFFMTSTSLRHVRFVNTCFTNESSGNRSPIDAVMNVCFGVRYEICHRILTLN
jgi:F-box domain